MMYNETASAGNEEKKVQPKVGIVIVNYNGQRYLKKNLQSIYGMGYQNFFVVLVDNASSDNSLRNIERYQYPVDVLKLNENKGFAGGNNIGIEYALKKGAEYVLLLNVDTEVDENLLDVLVSKADDHTVTAPKMYRDKRRENVWYAGGAINHITGKVRHLDEKTEDGITQVEVDFITGCCMLIHKNIFKKAGLFDESFFMYCEDTDLCLRFKDCGFKLLYIPGVSIWHKIGGSSSDSNGYFTTYYIIRNSLFVIKKNQAHIQMSAYRVALRYLIGKETIYPDNVRVRWIAVKDFLLNRKGYRYYNLFRKKYYS